MAAEPIFQSMPSLREDLRLRDLPADSQAALQVDLAVSEARTSFWRRLGAQRVDSLKALEIENPPTTDLGYLRELARTTEVKVVYRRLLFLMTTLVADAGGDALQLWNDDSAFRNKGPAVIAQELRMVDQEIEGNFELLGGSESAGEEFMGHAASFGSELDDSRRQVGNSIYRTSEDSCLSSPI